MKHSDNEDEQYQNIYVIAIVVLRGKFIVMQMFIQSEKKRPPKEPTCTAQAARKRPVKELKINEERK